MEHSEIFQKGRMVVIRIDDPEKEPGWFVGMVIRGTPEGYLVRVSCPKEYYRPVYEVPKRKWYARPTKARGGGLQSEAHENEFQLAWSGWTELPQDPLFVLFSRIASQKFLRNLQDRLSGKDTYPELTRDCVVPAGRVFSLDREKLSRAIFA